MRIRRYILAYWNQFMPPALREPSEVKVSMIGKVIENTQRDLNITLINELALIFERLDIDTDEVLAAAATKWNLLPFKPGLVGGQCIGVDPCYLTCKAQEIGCHPEVILAVRRINDSTGRHIVDRLIKLMTKNAINVVVLDMCLVCKENCPDVRNARKEFDAYGIALTETMAPSTHDAVVLAVAYDCFVEMGSYGIRHFTKLQRALFDVEHVLPKREVKARL